MSLVSALSGIAFSVLLFGWCFFLIFGRVTVRKLERDPEVRSRLGFEAISGWRIFNVAEALVLPKSFFQKVKGTRLSGMWADASLLRARTNTLDRVLAHVFVWTFMSSTAALMLLMVLDWFGVFAG